MDLDWDDLLRIFQKYSELTTYCMAQSIMMTVRIY